MSYSVTYTTTKPENVQWFKDVQPSTVKTINEWIVTNPGLISVGKDVVTSTTLVKTYVFDSEQSFNAYKAANNLNANVAARRAYNEQNGITTSIRKP